MNDERIVRYTRDSLPASRTDWRRVDAMFEEGIEANALSDPDNPPLTDEELAGLEPSVPGSAVDSAPLRVDADLLHYFRAQGPDYEARINRVLRDRVRAQRQASA